MGSGWVEAEIDFKVQVSIPAWSVASSYYMQPQLVYMELASYMYILVSTLLAIWLKLGMSREASIYKGAIAPDLLWL